MEQKKTIAVIVENQPGVLARIAGLFSGRGFNIDSLAVGETEDATTSRVTIVAKGDDLVLEQIIKQLNKLIDVIKVIDMTGGFFIEREMALIRVSCSLKNKNSLSGAIKLFDGKILDSTKESCMIEVTGTDEKINSFIGALQKFDIKEMVRTGTIAMSSAGGNIPKPVPHKGKREISKKK